MLVYSVEGVKHATNGQMVIKPFVQLSSKVRQNSISNSANLLSFAPYETEINPLFNQNTLQDNVVDNIVW